MAKKRINKPKSSIKHRTNKHKTNIKLITEPAFLPNTCYVRLWVFKNKNVMERLIKSLQDKHDAFIGNRKDQITSAKAEGFKSGLLWAIETAKSIIEQDLLDDEWNEQLLEELRKEKFNL